MRHITATLANNALAPVRGWRWQLFLLLALAVFALSNVIATPGDHAPAVAASVPGIAGDQAPGQPALQKLHAKQRRLPALRVETAARELPSTNTAADPTLALASTLARATVAAYVRITADRDARQHRRPTAALLTPPGQAPPLG